MKKSQEELERRINELEKLNTLYRKIIDNLPVGIQVFDNKGFSHTINEQQKELLGLPDLSTGIGKFNVLTDPYSKAMGASEIYSKAYKGKEYEHIYEYNLGIEENKWDTRKESRIFHEKIVPLMDKEENTEYVLAILSDVTERDRYEKGLRESEESHRDFVNHSPDILYKFSSKRGAIYWSERVKDILGFEVEELKKDPFLWNKSIHPDDREKVKEAISNFEKGEKYSIEYRIGNKRGEWVWLHDYIMYKKKIGDEVIIEGHATEITRRKELEMELEAVKQRFEMAMHATNDGLWDWNLITNEIYYSPNWKKMLGYEENELPDKFSVWENLVHPDDLKNAWNVLNDHISGKRERFDIEFKMKHKDGRWVDVLSRANAFFDERGKAYRVVGTHVDITERKKVKKALEDSELRWKFAIEGNNDGLWDWDLESNEVFYSAQWKKMLGYEEHEISNTLEEWNKRVHPDDLEEATMDIQKHLDGKTDVYINEHRVKCKDGSWKWILDRGKIVQRDDQGKPLRMIGTHSDISERKLAEQELEASRIKFKTVFDILDVGLTITNEQGNIIDCNKASERILGITKEQHLNRQLKGKEWKILRPDFSPKPYDEFAGVRAMREKRPVYNVEMGIVKDEGITWISSSASPLNLEGYGVLIAYFDITELKENEQKFIELNATKDKFFSIIAHDLRSPLGAAVNFSELALEQLSSKNYEKIERYIRLINQGSKQSFNLLNNLMQWARLQTGQIDFNPVSLKLGELVNNIFNLLEANCEEKQLSVNIEIDPDLQILADHSMIETIIRNLFSNAIKYTPNNGSIEIRALKKDGYVMTIVEDTGIGIDKENLDKLFQIDGNISTPGTNEEKGTGLGLILCKEFVEKHQGKIWVESKAGKGTKFIFTIASSGSNNNIYQMTG